MWTAGVAKKGSSQLHVVNNVGQSVFDSANLQDGRTRAAGIHGCGPLSPVFPACWPLPNKLKVAGNVASGISGSATFTFNYASFLGDAGPTWAASSGGGVFNSYPSNGPGGEAFGDDLLPVGTGLPFNVVAVQVGQTP